MKTLNEVYSSLSARRRYEVWFVRVRLAEGGAWWFRYLLMNPGRGGCGEEARGAPVQVWATYFPSDGKPQTLIQGFSLDRLDLSAKAESPFHFRVSGNAIGENSCRGELAVEGHTIEWDLQYASTFRVTLSDKGWIGFSRTPHFDAVFSGQIVFDGRRFYGDPLGFGLQGHNCGYRHRGFWRWSHAYFAQSEVAATTLEALVYDMPLGLVFRKAVLWHQGKSHRFAKMDEIACDSKNLLWQFHALSRNGLELEAAFDGGGPSLHRLPYLRTDCKGSFEVANNSLARASVRLKDAEGQVEELRTMNGAVLEMGGQRFHSSD